MEWSDYITFIASLIGSLTVIGGALIWVYKKLVSDPDKRIAEKIQRENNVMLKESLDPLTKSIEMLNMNLEDSKQDRIKLNQTVDKHAEQLTDHGTRITVLESWKRGK